MNFHRLAAAGNDVQPRFWWLCEETGIPEFVKGERQNPHSINAPHDGWCPVCKTKGQTQALKTYRINFTQSIFLCTNPQCIYPLGYTPLDNIIANTADLKNISPNKQKKRDLSNLSPTPLPFQKRLKIDLQVVGDSHTGQADPCTFVPGFPALENETSSQPGLKECTDSQMQNVSGMTNSFSSSAVWNRSSFSVLPMGSPSRYALSEPDGSPAIQDDHQKGLEVMDPLNNGFLLPLHPETDHSMGKVQEELKQSSDTEMTKSLSDEGNLNGPALMSDYMPSCVSPHTPLLKNCQEESQVNENSSKDTFLPQSIIDNVSDQECRLHQSCDFAPSEPDGSPAVQDDHQEALQNTGLEVMNTLNNDSLLPLYPETDHSMGKLQEEVKQSSDTEMTRYRKECRLQQNCEFIKDNVCLVEPPKEQMENTDDLTDGNVEAPLCNNEASLLIPDGQLEISANTVTSELQQEETEQQINLSSLQDISPPTCPEVAVQENLSESLQLMQESRDVTATSQSFEGELQECLADSSKPLSSPSCVVAEDSEKGQSTLPPCELKECQPESMSKDNLDIPLDLPSPVPNGSVVSAEGPTPIPNSLLLQELVQNCQNMNSEERNPSNSLQDLQPESQVEESLFNNCDSPTSSLPPVEDQTFADASAISLPGDQMSEECDTGRVCQENDMASLADTLVGNQPVLHSDDGTLESVCEPYDISASMSDDCNTQRDGKPINKTSLPGPQVVLQDCLKCHCGLIIPSQNLRKNACDDPTISASSGKDQACSDAAAITVPHSSSTAIVKGDGNDKSLNKMYLPGPQILLQDCLKCHCGRNIPSRTLQNTQTPNKDSVSEVDSSSCEAKVLTDCEEVSAASDIEKDSNTVASAQKPVSAPPVECESLLSKQKKTFYENTTLPDLLLDIQPEHRMEEPLLEAPSPACEATESMTPHSDMEITKQDVWQNQQVKESDDIMETEVTEILNDSVQDGSKLSNTLETSLNSDGLADESHEAMETKEEDSAEDVKAPARKKLKVTEKRLQWKNKHSLCWLDCILSALVQSETLIRFFEEGRPHLRKESIIHNLFKTYGEATTMYIKSLKKPRAGNKRPKHEKCLNEVRKKIFQKLKPLLKCKLGKKESPVFAFPLLLKLDPQTEKLFTHSFMWRFECQACGYSYQQRNQKTMTTFTKVLPEWRPLNAVHIGPCNRCQNTEQKRSMVLEKLSSVFMVHFVEGLPSSNLKEYSFQLKGNSYEIKAVIKYKNKHFCTWISNNDGTWLESDDLRGSFCRRHQQFRVRADDIHIAIWERTDGHTFEENVELDEAEQDSLNVSMVSEGLSSSLEEDAEPSQKITPAVALNTSDPLAGMDGFADDDVITLTLVEIPLDANGRPIETVTELQPPATCTSLVEADIEDAHSVELETNVQLESREDCSLMLPVSSDVSAETVPLRNCSVILSPLKPVGEAIATSTPNQKPHDTKNSSVGNWMTRLLNPLAANKKTLTLKPCAPFKVTDADSAPKKAQNFNGFQGRSMNQSSVLASKIFPSNTVSTPSFRVPVEKVMPVSKPSPAPATSDFRIPRSSGLDYSRLLSKEGRSSSEDKIRKLRLKLLKKLKAKKNELAILEKYAKTQPSGDQANGVPQGGFNRKEHLRGYMQELQEQIDHTDNDSVCTMSSSTSICSSPGDAEFFAELFSPSPPVNQPNDCKYLDMLADGCGIAAAGQLQQANDDQGGGGVLQPTSQPSHYPTTSTANASKEESLLLMSNSTLALVNEGDDYFDFDDYF
ncbi:SUMO-specific isopeptidase USPL1 [Bufo gargarizans]|uniref:SUMO-specific isopeptidase USPL1 n=1 Tax=Bufo gargarizans TaxID=30331 RepID=UPI001CF37D38|nr:SUMO-specific isopeptidase USPL1 [Bufo gargarizans]